MLVTKKKKKGNTSNFSRKGSWQERETDIQNNNAVNSSMWIYYFIEIIILVPTFALMK